MDNIYHTEYKIVTVLKYNIEHILHIIVRYGMDWKVTNLLICIVLDTNSITHMTLSIKNWSLCNTGL